MLSVAIYIALVLGFFALIQGCLYLTADIREEAQNAASQLQLRRPTLADGVSPWLREILLTTPVRKFDNLVQTSGTTTRTEHVLLGMMFATVMLVVLIDLSPLPQYAFPGGVLGGVGLPLLFLAKRRQMRMAKLTSQLPETIDMIVRSLRAGHPIPACIAMVSREMPMPIGAEFKRLNDAMTYGLDLRDGLAKMTQRLDSVRELKFVVSAIRIQSITGGNLAEILASLSNLMREQQKLRMKIRAISAEGRLSGNILAALPVGVVVLLNIINPQYYLGFQESPVILYALEFSAALIVGGYLLIRRVVNIRV